MKMFVAVLAIITMSSCATILQPGPDRIPVRSEPDGAQVLLNGMPVGATPMVVSVNRSDNCSIEIKKDGYQTVTLDRGKVVSGWVFGNIIVGGLFGVGVDLITNNQGHYPSDPVYTKLLQSRLPASQ